MRFWGVTKIKPGTLNINIPIDIGLFRLEYDPAKFGLMISDRTEQEWFSNGKTNGDKRKLPARLVVRRIAATIGVAASFTLPFDSVQ